jgi:cytochrome c oxidase subunit 2
MLFTVKVVSEAEFESQMQALEDAGNTGQLGPEYNTNTNLPGNGTGDDSDEGAAGITKEDAP